jgi:hypothetical protein
MNNLRRAIIRGGAALFLFAAAGAESAPGPNRAPGVSDAVLETRPLMLDRQEPGRVRLGALEWRGGIELKSASKDFGGLSGLRRLPDGRLLMVSDRGLWVMIMPTLADGRLTGAQGLTMAPLLGLDGVPLYPDAQRDAEALELLTGSDGRITARIGFEHHHRALCYTAATADELLTAIPHHGCDDLVGWEMDQPANGGLEAMAEMEGQSFVVSEERLNPLGGHDARLKIGEERFHFGLATEGIYKPTDAAWLKAEDGSLRLLLLYRAFSPLSGVRAKLKLYDLRGVKTGALADGETLASFEGPVIVDNMEGLLVEQAEGRTFITLVSDDNFNALQKTILLRFEWLQRP